MTSPLLKTQRETFIYLCLIWKPAGNKVVIYSFLYWFNTSCLHLPSPLSLLPPPSPSLHTHSSLSLSRRLVSCHGDGASRGVCSGGCCHGDARHAAPGGGGGRGLQHSGVRGAITAPAKRREPAAWAAVQPEQLLPACGDRGGGFGAAAGCSQSPDRAGWVMDRALNCDRFI